MIYDASTLPLPLRLEADLCVIGSGAGGSMAALAAAQAGLRVLVLEAGAWVPPSAMSQREEEMFPKLFVASAAQTTTNLAVKVLQGRGVGGSTLHNLNLCKRIPPEIFASWAAAGNESFGSLRELYPEVEALLGVGDVPAALQNRHNRILAEGVQALGWRGGPLRHNRTGCVGSGFCELGCAFDAKNNAAKIVLPRAIALGAEVIAHCQATHLVHRRGEVRGVRALALALAKEGHAVRGEIEIRAERVCVAASASATPALLLRSGIPDPSETTGRGLRLHPALTVAAEMAEPVDAWRGIPQSFECTEWLDFAERGRGRVWIVPAFAHPVGTATMAPGHGETHAAFMSRYRNLAVLTAMVHDETRGAVTPAGDRGLAMRYWPNAADLGQLGLGAWASARLLFAAGARRVIVAAEPPLIFERGESLESLRTLEITPGRFTLTATHPMASVPASDDPARGAVGADGRHHHIGGLWIADASLFPTSIGVPPQLSTYAVGLRVGRALSSSYRPSYRAPT